MLSGTADTLQLTGLVLRLALTRGEQREQVVHRVIHMASASPHPQRGNVPFTARLALFMALLATPRIAAAEPTPVLTPTEIFEPEKGPGIRLGSAFILYNQTRVQALYDSNIYNVEQNRTDDTLALVESNFRLAANLPRHEAEILAGVAVRRYADTSAENSETYHVDGRAFLDLADRIGVRAKGGYARGVEQRGTAGDLFATDRPVLFDETHLEVSIDRTGGILETALAGSIHKRKYLNASINGITIDLGDRDTTIRNASFKVGYRLSPVMRVYAQIGGNDVKYDRNIGISRDSSGYSVLAGVHYEVTRLVDVEAAVGYMHQSFDTPGVAPESGLNYKLTATWTPTPKWRLTANGERTVDASPLGNVPAIVRSTFELKAQRALGDRVLVEAGVAYTDEEYRGVNRNDRRYSGFGDVQYRVTNNIAAVVEAGYRKQSGGAAGRSYSGASIAAGLRIAL